MDSPYAESLSFLLSQIGARTAERFAEQLAPNGVTPRAFAVLGTLAAAGPLTQQQLADRLGIHRNNMVDLIDELEASGWAQRRRSTTDRRAFEIHLTGPGRALQAALSTIPEALDGELAGTLTPAERAQLGAMLRRVAEALELTPGAHPYLRRRPG